MEFLEICGYGGFIGVVVVCDVYYGFFFVFYFCIVVIVGVIVGVGVEVVVVVMVIIIMVMMCLVLSFNVYLLCLFFLQVIIFEVFVVEMVVYGYLCVCVCVMGEGCVFNWQNWLGMLCGEMKWCVGCGVERQGVDCFSEEFCFFVVLWVCLIWVDWWFMVF